MQAKTGTCSLAYIVPPVPGEIRKDVIKNGRSYHLSHLRQTPGGKLCREWRMYQLVDVYHLLPGQPGQPGALPKKQIDRRGESGGEIMKILVACEESQAVCKAFRAKGHEVYSCDIEPCSGGRPEWHIQGDVLPLISQLWDMIIAFPPCTDLCSSGARWFKEKQADGRQQRSIEFFLRFTNLNCPKVAIENPVGIMSRLYRKPDQIIEPYQFGHPEKKATCLWLKELPKLKSTKIMLERDQKGWKMPPSKDRAKLRSKTYQGIADAMAEQWGGARL